MSTKASDTQQRVAEIPGVSIPTSPQQIQGNTLSADQFSQVLHNQNLQLEAMLNHQRDRQNHEIQGMFNSQAEKFNAALQEASSYDWVDYAIIGGTVVLTTALTATANYLLSGDDTGV